MPLQIPSRRLVVLLFSLVTLFSNGFVQAKTWYIERWGEDTVGPPACGKKTSPCLTIQFVLDTLAKKNDKLVVGPGRYVENIDIGTGAFGRPLEGIKLESTAGRHGTILEAEAADAIVITIRQPRVQVGKKGKGFTVKGVRSGGGGILASSNLGVSRLRIEGNKVIDSRFGIGLRGERNQVRNNIVVNNSYGTTTRGIACYLCDSVLLQENRVSENNGSISGIGIHITSSDRITVQRNLVSGHITNGIFVDAASEFGKIHDNAVDGGEQPVLMEDIEGSLLQGNIVSGAEEYGLAVHQQGNARPGQVKYNLAVNNHIGVYLQDLLGGKVERNTTVDSQTRGILLQSIDSQPAFSYNNTTFSSHLYIGDFDCGIVNDTVALPLLYKKHFFGAIDDVCNPDNFDPDTTRATRPSSLRVNRAKAL